MLTEQAEIPNNFTIGRNRLRKLFEAIYDAVRLSSDELITEQVKQHNRLLSIDVFVQTVPTHSSAIEIDSLVVTQEMLIAHWKKIEQKIVASQEFLEVAEELSGQTIKKLSVKWDSYTSVEKVDVITYGFSLDRLNSYLMMHPEFTSSYFTYLFEQPINWRQVFSSDLKLIIKRKLVEKPTKRFIKILQHPEELKETKKYYLKKNIKWAVKIESKKGGEDNGYAGNVLANHTLEDYGNNPILGTDKLSLDESGKKVLVKLPLINQWVPLYISWDSCFCMHLKYPLHLIQKLIIPSVFGDDHPNEFMHARVYTLYLSIRYLENRKRVSKKSSDKVFTKNQTSGLIKEWGSVNRKLAVRYEQLINEKLSDNSSI